MKGLHGTGQVTEMKRPRHAGDRIRNDAFRIFPRRLFVLLVFFGDWK